MAKKQQPSNEYTFDDLLKTSKHPCFMSSASIELLKEAGYNVERAIVDKDIVLHGDGFDLDADNEEAKSAAKLYCAQRGWLLKTGGNIIKMQVRCGDEYAKMYFIHPDVPQEPTLTRSKSRSRESVAA